jgi:hypothetical protein
MQVINLKPLARSYKNNGQHAEQVARYTLTGEICKADNKPFYMGADCLDLQIKTSRATVCIGLDIKAHIARDMAGRYGYVTADFKSLYIMTPSEWLEFAETFKTITTETAYNGGRVKTRLKTEGKAMREWLRAKA